MFSRIIAAIGARKFGNRAAMRRIGGSLAAVLSVGILAAPQPADAAAFLWVSARNWTYSAALARSPAGTAYFWGLSFGLNSFSYAYAYSYSAFGGAAAYAVAVAGRGGAGAWFAYGFADPWASVAIDIPLTLDPAALTEANQTADLTQPAVQGADQGSGLDDYTVSTTGITFPSAAFTSLNGVTHIAAYLYTGTADDSATDLCAAFGKGSGCTTGADSGGAFTDISSLTDKLDDSGTLTLLGELTDPTSLTTLTFNSAIGSGQLDNVILVAQTEEIPEPSSLLLLGAGLLGLVAVRRSKAI